MEKIEFLKDPATYSSNVEFVVYISQVEGKHELLDKLSTALCFPDYFGYNWDALLDCLRDFSWVKKKGVILVHTKIPVLSDMELQTYIKILVDATRDWKEEEDHYLKVIFPEEARSLIAMMLV